MFVVAKYVTQTYPPRACFCLMYAALVPPLPSHAQSGRSAVRWGGRGGRQRRRRAGDKRHGTAKGYRLRPLQPSHSGVCLVERSTVVVPM